jgi:hypothetical protein
VGSVRAPASPVRAKESLIKETTIFIQLLRKDFKEKML